MSQDCFLLSSPVTNGWWPTTPHCLHLMLLTLQSTMWFSWTRGWKRKTKKRKLYNGDSGHCFLCLSGPCLFKEYTWILGHMYNNVQQWIAASFMALKYKRIHRKTSLVTLHLKGWSPFWEEAELSLLTSRNISVACWWNCSFETQCDVEHCAALNSLHHVGSWKFPA